MQRKLFCIDYMGFTRPLHLEPKDQTYSGELAHIICPTAFATVGGNKHTRMYAKRIVARGKRLQQRDAHKFVTVGGNTSA